MILPAIISALALAGAPSNTTVVCHPDYAGPMLNNSYGLTYWSDDHIELDYHVCAGLLLLSVNAMNRARILKLNPGFDSLRSMGIAAVVVLHESYHVALQSPDETDVECRAMAKTVEFLSQYLGGSQLAVAMSWASTYDSTLPPAYHSRACA